MSFTYGTTWGDYGDEKVVKTAASGATAYTGSEDFGVMIGTRLVLPDGRVFRYAFSDGAAGAGTGVQSSIALANQDTDIAVETSASVGDKSVSITFGTSPNTDVVADQYANGYLFVNDSGTSGTGEGHVYRIRSQDAHVAADVSASPAVSIYLMDGDTIVEALTKDHTQVGLVANPYMHVIPSPGAAQTARTVGFAPAEVADNSFFWVQTWGEAAVLADGTLVIFRPVRMSDGTAGAVENYASQTASEEQVVGFATNFLAATTEFQFVFLQISP
jgi:hypothetical protein